MTRQQYLDLLGREADPATGRRMVFGRLPIKPREADLLGAVAELAPDHVTYVGPRRTVAAALGCSPKSVDRYVSAVCAAGYLAKCRQGNGLRLSIDVAAVVNAPDSAHHTPQGVDSNGQQTRDPSAPKSQGLDTSGQVRLPASIPTRRELAAKLVVTLGQAVALVTALVCYGRHCRKLKNPVNAVRNGDSWQLLLFEAEPQAAPVSAPKSAPKFSTAGVDKSGQVRTSPHEHVNDLMIHEAQTPDRTAPAPTPKRTSGGWPCPITTQVLRDPAKVDDLFRHAVSRGWIKASEVNHRGFAGAAEQAAAKGRDPGKLFTTLVKRRAWEQASKDGGVTQWAEAKAAERRKAKPARTTVPLPYLRDPDEALAASRDDQARRLLERYGAAAQPAPRPTAEAVAV